MSWYNIPTGCLWKRLATLLTKGGGFYDAYIRSNNANDSFCHACRANHKTQITALQAKE